jgi:hypothetical protein
MEKIYQTHKIAMDKYYTILGSEDFIDEYGYPRLSEQSDLVYAKCVLSRKPKNIVSKSNLAVDKPSYKYYILTVNREAYDPFAIADKKNSFVDTVCKKKNDFLQVNQLIFNKYLNFLKTQNQHWLKETNRDIK